MLDKYKEEYEFKKIFLVADYKQKIRELRNFYTDEEFALIEKDDTHVYYTNLRSIATERDAAVQSLLDEYEAKTE